MNTKNYIQTSVINLLLLYPILLVLPIGTSFTSICLALLAISSLLYWKFNGDYKTDNKWLLLFTIPFIIYLLGLINSTEISYGIKFLGRNFSLIIFPLIFIFLSKLDIPFNKIKKAYLLGSAITSIYLIYLFVYYFHIGTKFYMVLSLEIYHATFLGVYLLTASLIAFDLFKQNNHKLYLSLTLFFLIAALLTSSRIIFICDFILFIFYCYSFLTKKKHFYLAVIFLFSVFTAIIFIVPSIKEKFIQITDLEKIGFDKNNYYSISSRFAKIEAAIKVINKFPFFGTGTGDLYEELLVEYRDMGFTMGYKNRYNPHNQFLDNIVRNGLIGGFIALFFLYLFPLWIAFKTNNKLLFGFMFLISITSLTESFLGGHRGLVFYSFMLSFFLLSNSNNKLHEHN